MAAILKPIGEKLVFFKLQINAIKTDKFVIDIRFKAYSCY